MATYSKSARTKERIFKEAQALFLSRGYAATSLKDIAEAAGVSTGTLYRHFPSKGDLLFQIRRRSLDHLHQVAADLPDAMPLQEKLGTVIAEDVLSVAQGLAVDGSARGDDPRTELALAIRRESYGSLEQLEREEAFRSELRSIYRGLIEREQEQGRFDPQVDAGALSQTVSALYFQAIDRSILGGGADVAAQLRPELELLFGR